MTFSLSKDIFLSSKRHIIALMATFTGILSVACFWFFYKNNLAISYNDARSHLDIGRRVVEGLKPGIAQIGSVWLPLPHLLMIPTIWNSFFWHSGLSGALQSMMSFVLTTLLIMLFLKRLRVGILGQLTAAFVFIANTNILYLQSTAMTELLLIVTMMAACYELLRWYQTDQIVFLVRTAFFVMLSTLIRYDGWFLCFYIFALVAFRALRKKGFRAVEGLGVFYCTLAGVGIFLWFAWNALIFKDPLYFILGPYSAHAQQEVIAQSGMLATKGNMWLSFVIYFFASVYNIGAVTLLIGVVGGIALLAHRKLSADERIATTALIAPFIFNVLALYFGHSVLFLQGFSGTSWFNVRYGILLLPSIAIWIGYLVHRFPYVRWAVITLLCLVTFFSFTSRDAVTIDDATVGASQKNVSQISLWLHDRASHEPGFVLISAASHDAIIFSSELPMSRFIHEGTGTYWENATSAPDRWARWIVMRTYDESDQTYKLLLRTDALTKYDKVQSFPFADVYELKPEYLSQLNTAPVRQK